ncbi:MAG: RNA pseudouridine synthase [Bacteroidetes Order II. Incertae sedis bacterium]|nr:RNA pseudouridine synthase [Bacteroidetes Order II. bacterium]
MMPDVLYEDNHLLVINKPAGLLAQEDATGDLDVLTICKQYLKEKYTKPGAVFLGLVHRLDRPASGVMVLARTSKAASRLSEQIRSRTIQKTYWIMVEGKVSGNGTCEDYLLKEDSFVRLVDGSQARAQLARLSWRSLKVFSKDSLVEVALETGRPHQIRVQFSARNMPIRGDLKYGAKTTLPDRSIALHCRVMTFKHPTQDQLLSIMAPVPQIWGLALYE